MIDAIRAELIKLTAIRSVVAAAVAYGLSGIGFGVLFGMGGRLAIQTDDPLLRSDFTPELAGLESVGISMVAVIVLGVLAATVEFSTDMHQLSLLAQPRRWRFVVGKIGTLVVMVVVLALPVVVITYAATQVALGPYGSTLGAPGVPAAIVGAVGALVLMSLIFYACGAIARNAVVPLAVLLPMTLAGSQLLTFFKATRELARYLPDHAARQMYALTTQEGALAPLEGFLVVLTWAGVLMAIAILMTEQRSA